MNIHSKAIEYLYYGQVFTAIPIITNESSKIILLRDSPELKSSLLKRLAEFKESFGSEDILKITRGWLPCELDENTTRFRVNPEVIQGKGVGYGFGLDIRGKNIQGEQISADIRAKMYKKKNICKILMFHEDPGHERVSTDNPDLIRYLSKHLRVLAGVLQDLGYIGQIDYRPEYVDTDMRRKTTEED